MNCDFIGRALDTWMHELFLRIAVAANVILAVPPGESTLCAVTLRFHDQWLTTVPGDSLEPSDKRTDGFELDAIDLAL